MARIAQKVARGKRKKTRTESSGMSTFQREVEVFPIKEMSNSLLELENPSRCMS